MRVVSAPQHVVVVGWFVARGGDVVGRCVVVVAVVAVLEQEGLEAVVLVGVAEVAQG